NRTKVRFNPDFRAMARLKKPGQRVKIQWYQDFVSDAPGGRPTALFPGIGFAQQIAADNVVRKYAIGSRQSPIWKILVQSALSITFRQSGLLRIVQKDVPNWRSASADCLSYSARARVARC